VIHGEEEESGRDASRGGVVFDSFVSGFDVKVAATIITARPSFSHRFDIISTLSMQMDKVKQFSCS